MKSAVYGAAVAPLVFWAAALSGCTQTEEIMARQPDEVLKSEKGPSEIASCLAYQNDARVQDLANGVKLVQLKNMYGVLVFSFMISPDGQGSTIEMRKGNAGFGFKYRECLGVN